MAKGLKSMIRLNEWKVDQKRRVLGEKLSEIGALEDGLVALEDELLREQSTAQQSPHEAGLFYGAYANGVINRRDRFKTDIENMEEQIVAAREDLNVAYRELKKFEIIHKQREKREREELDKKQQQQLEELGLDNHRRRHEQ
ncbi:MAG: flagellar FliJ family protein [Rhodospirillales bacterium]|nr:flagellar FliJ family protein [Rhodospirillales bacterium]